VTNAVLYSYLSGWAVTSIGLVLTARHESHPTSVAVMAGALWPLLLLGAVQFVAIALVAEASRVREPGPKSIDDELEELLAEYRQTVAPLDN
jgi:hypothetical protein